MLLTFNLIPDDPYYLTSYPEANYYVNRTDNITLTCLIKAYPPPNVYWQLPAGVIVDNRQTTALASSYGGDTVEQTITIVNASTDDRGAYHCYANNSFGLINRTSILTVYCEWKLFSHYSIQQNRLLTDVLKNKCLQ